MMGCSAMMFRAQIRWILLAFAMWGGGFPAPQAVPLQPLIDATPAGGTLTLAPGRYEGPVLISRPITLDGSSRRAMIDGGGKGTVITVRANGVVLRDLVVTGSGESHDTVDAAILVESSRNRIENNLIRDALFGIDLKEAHDNIITGNDITSKSLDLGVRGDGMRLWASHRNVVRDNLVHDSRDLVVWYSNGNRLEGNRGWNNRYSIHFMYGENNDVVNNDFRHNSVGIYLMYSKDTRVAGNRIFNSLGAGGIGLGLKEADRVDATGNSIVYCATGIYVDQSPLDPDAVNRFEDNEIAFNVNGITFHSDLEGNEFRGNRLRSNLQPVLVEGNGTARRNVWEGNYWSDYEGFDRNRDHLGDTPFEQRAYMDQLWAAHPAVRFFYGSPVLTFLDYLARMAPFSEPRLILVDRKPVLSVPAPPAAGSAVTTLPGSR